MKFVRGPHSRSESVTDLKLVDKSNTRGSLLHLSSHLIRSDHLRAFPHPVTIASHEEQSLRPNAVYRRLGPSDYTSRCNNLSNCHLQVVPDIQYRTRATAMRRVRKNELPKPAFRTVYSTLCNHAAVDFIIMKGLLRHSFTPKYHPIMFGPLPVLFNHSRRRSTTSNVQHARLLSIRN